MAISKKIQLRSNSCGPYSTRVVRALFVAAWAICGVVVPAQAAAQRKTDHVFSRQKFLQDCPPGYRVQIKLGTATLYVQKEWLGPRASQSLWDSFETSCPSGPVILSFVDFGYAVLPLLNTNSDLGRKLLRFTVAGRRPGPANPSSDWMRGLPETDGKPHDLRKPWIEDPTLRPPLRKYLGPGTKNPTLRAYLIHYPPNDLPSSETASVEISCGGGEQRVLRACHLTSQRSYFADVSYGYIVSQSQLPIPDRKDAISVDPATEPGALLQFDMRVRHWIEEIQREP